jgi:hypothetical protein
VHAFDKSSASKSGRKNKQKGDEMSQTLQAKPRKLQDDRLLKRLSRKERRQQEVIRQMIQTDPVFKTI